MVDLQQDQEQGPLFFQKILKTTCSLKIILTFAHNSNPGNFEYFTIHINRSLEGIDAVLTSLQIKV